MLTPPLHPSPKFHLGIFVRSLGVPHKGGKDALSPTARGLGALRRSSRTEAKIAAYAHCMTVGQAAPSRGGAAWLAVWGTGLRRVRSFELVIVIPTITLVVSRLLFSDSEFLTSE